MPSISSRRRRRRRVCSCRARARRRADHAAVARCSILGLVGGRVGARAPRGRAVCHRHLHAAHHLVVRVDDQHAQRQRLLWRRACLRNRCGRGRAARARFHIPACAPKRCWFTWSRHSGIYGAYEVTSALGRALILEWPRNPYNVCKKNHACRSPSVKNIVAQTVRIGSHLVSNTAHCCTQSEVARAPRDRRDSRCRKRRFRKQALKQPSACGTHTSQQLRRPTLTRRAGTAATAQQQSATAAGRTTATLMISTVMPARATHSVRSLPRHTYSRSHSNGVPHQ